MEDIISKPMKGRYGIIKDVKLHLIGIGGVGMAGLAVLLKSRGHDVTGCDLRPIPRTRALEAQGIAVAYGHDPRHLDGAEGVIATPAVRVDNPEIVRAKEIGLRYRGAVLAELVSGCDSIAVCGSHGKTTTATWIAKLLKALGEDPSWCIGGETGSFPVAGVGRGPLVVEADESDGTLALYHAKTLVVTNCEYDHPDHFKTFADYLACYDAARRNAADVIESEALPVLEGFDELAPHNRRNARAAIEVALRRGHSLADILTVLPPIVAELPDRRFQRIWPSPSIDVSHLRFTPSVYTDYAHHPTEMRCAIGMARQICRGRLRVLFQPHRYSRTKALLGDFAAALEGADETVLCPTYSAFERPIEGGDIADLYRACREKGGSGLYLARSCGEAWEHARNSMNPGDLTLLLGAGDIIGLVPRIQEDLTFLPPPVVRRVWIGSGSNTWKSDLRLNVEYVKTQGPAGRPGASLGIAWMAGIPGTIGGWIKMNAGAFGHSISEVLSEVKIDGEWKPASACGFGYRHSDIRGEIQDFRLKSPADWEKADEVDYLSRRKRFPAGTFGSFFKNPEGDHAGRLLEQAGAKELRVGGAYVWQEHANVIVRGEGATPSDVLALARLMYNRVYFRFGIALEPEVCGITFA